VNWQVLKLPQCWIFGVVVLSMAIKSIKGKGVWLSPKKWRSPSIDDFVELLAYFAGLYGTKAVFIEAVKHKDHPDVGIALMAAGGLLAYVSARGAWRTITKPDPATPTTSPPPP
jgi:hypothetical protein